MVGAEAGGDVEFVFVAGGRDDGCAKGFCDLDGGDAYAACCCMDEDPVACVGGGWLDMVLV